MNAAATYRLGASSWTDTLATRWHLAIRNPMRELSTPRKLRIAKHLDFSTRPRILEIGPSAGVVTAAPLCRLQQNLTLFDLWAYHRQWALLAAANPNFKCVLGNANQPLPFGDGSFDSCIFMGALSYIASPMSVLSEVHRVLRKGGVFFVSSTRRPANNRAFELHRLDVSQPTLWNADELNPALQQSGFEILESYDYLLYPGIGYAFWRELSKFAYSEAMHRWLAARHPNKQIYACTIARTVG